MDKDIIISRFIEQKCVGYTFNNTYTVSHIQSIVIATNGKRYSCKQDSTRYRDNRQQLSSMPYDFKELK